MAAETEQAQCHAITEDGERCDRPAREDGFCYQHDESNETVDDFDGTSEAGDGSGGSAADDGENAPAGEDVAPDRIEGVRDVREAAIALAPEIIGRELDAVIEVDSNDDGWLAVVEVVERPAVPDSQDILGRYEIDLADGSVTGYRRVDRYRRSDTDASDAR